MTINTLNKLNQDLNYAYTNLTCPKHTQADLIPDFMLLFHIMANNW